MSPASGRASTAFVFVFALAAPGCWDHVGISCPEGQATCNGEDFAAPQPDAAGAERDLAAADASHEEIDLAVPHDLAPRRDLAPAPDMATCLAACTMGCCDTKGVCHAPPSVEGCGLAGAICTTVCDASSDSCVMGTCACGGGKPCPTGLRCQGGMCVCDGQSCPKGCCRGNYCVMQVANVCGIGGGACTACNPTTTDGCTGGACSCGKLAPCDGGQHCVNGVCQCDSISCGPGCCAANNCYAPSLATCAQGGMACVRCDPNLADSCAFGGCRCGMNPACTAGQQCVGGACVCSVQSCPMGCCHNNACQAPSQATCGIKGAACVSCPATTDGCTNGQCSCGGNAPCAMGQDCMNGKCMCTARSCPGCCDANNMCNPPSLMTCGINGAACGACQMGLICFNGKCTANPASCAGTTVVCGASDQCVSCDGKACPGTVICPPGVCLASCNDCMGLSHLCTTPSTNGGPPVLTCTDANCTNCMGKCM